MLSVRSLTLCGHIVIRGISMEKSLKKIPIKVAHYGRFDPRVRTGGVETFARNLQIVFEEVEFLTPEAQNLDAIIASKTPVICENQMVSDWPEDFPVIGFQHGVAAVKSSRTKSWTDRKLAKAQASRQAPQHLLGHARAGSVGPL